MRLYRKPFGAVDDFDEYAEVALLPRRVSRAEIFCGVRFNQLFENPELAAMLCARAIEAKYQSLRSPLLPVVISATELSPSNFIITQRGLRFFFAPGLVKPNSTTTESMLIRIEALQSAKPISKWWSGKVDEITEEQRQALAHSSLSGVIHLDDDMPGATEVQAAQRLAQSQRNAQEAKEAARNYFDWMEETQKDYEPNIRLKTLEFVLFMEPVAYKSGGLLYRFRDRGEYLELAEKEELGKVRSWFVQKAEAAAGNVAEYSNEAIEKAQEYIRHNYRKDLSLEEMSRQMDMSPYYFSKLFKEVTGSNFVEYVTGVRMKRARELLLEGGKSIKQICAEIGYSDPNYFSRIFKRYEGCTPTEFREGKR